MSDTDDLKELGKKGGGRRSKKKHCVKNLRLHVAACIASAAVGVVAVVVSVSNLNAEKLSAGGQEEPAPSYTYTDMNATMYATSLARVRVRAIPSADGFIVGILLPNQEVTVTGQCNETGWYRIEFDGETAYVNNEYISEIKAEVHE